MHGIEEAAAAGGMAHHQALEALATRALAAGDDAAAFALADRRCRIRPAPEAHAFVLRAEIHFRLGRRRFALVDLERALAVAPEDIAANRRLLAWGRGEQRLRAARTLLRLDRDLATLITALDLLEARGERSFASLQVFDGTVRGWVIWQGDDAVAVTIAGDLQSATTYIEPQPGHPLATSNRHAATFEAPRAPCSGPQTVSVTIGDATCLSVGAPPNARNAPVAKRPVEAFAGVTVIVPVYGDFAATRACLDRLVGELDADRRRAVIVDDAAPDPRMAPYLAALADHPAVTLLTHGRNLGFVAAVNRALAATPGGDVILLNADTIPPPGFIERLAEAARREPGIGIVTALSNDAETTSFPLPGRANPLGSPEEALALDQIAAKVNAGRVVGLPSGTGFCLYLTRDCLDAVGPLSATFHRGYFEDVELCLRARAHGFRTVCDTSVFVGHAGSRSFGSEKAALALRNFAVLASSHPDYASECAAFADADPLRPARAAIERRAAPRTATRLVVTGSGALAAIARGRAHPSDATPERGLILTIGAGGVARLAAADGGIPQSQAFDLATERGRTALIEALPDFSVAGIDILDPHAVPPALLDLLLAGDLPFRVLIADDGLFVPPGETLTRPPATSPAAAAWRRLWQPALAAATAILPLTAEAHAFAIRLLPSALTGRLASAPAATPRPKRRRRGPYLGLLAPRADAHARALAGDLALRLAAEAPKATLVVLGDLPDAAGLLRHGKVTVTGTLDPEELPVLCRHHGVGRLFVERRRPLFGHPLDEAARATGLPLAFRDWSLGAADTAPGDLAIDPFASRPEAVTALLRWMT